MYIVLDTKYVHSTDQNICTCNVQNSFTLLYSVPYKIVQYLLGQLELNNSGFISSVSPERQYLTVQYILGQLELDNTGFISSVSPERQYITVQYIL